MKNKNRCILLLFVVVFNINKLINWFTVFIIFFFLFVFFFFFKLAHAINFICSIETFIEIIKQNLSEKMQRVIYVESKRYATTTLFSYFFHAYRSWTLFPSQLFPRKIFPRKIFPRKIIPRKVFPLNITCQVLK